jgi:hypothetical protein
MISRHVWSRMGGEGSKSQVRLGILGSIQGWSMLRLTHFVTKGRKTLYFVSR